MQWKMGKLKDYFKIYRFNTDKITEITDNHKILLFVRSDLIGDYIASRHLYRILRQSEKYKNYKFVLIGNISWREIALAFDCDCIDEFIWINRKDIENKEYRKRFKHWLSKREYDCVINPQYSRDFISEEIVKIISAKEKICLHGDNYNLSEYQRARYDDNYTKVIKNNPQKQMYLYRTNEMLEYLTGEKQYTSRPKFILKENHFNLINFDWKTPYVIMFPFARTNERIYKIEYFLELAKYIYEKYCIKTLICGSKEDWHKLKKLDIHYVENICGLYPLADLPYIFNKAKLILTNDTMAVHIASGVNENVICFSNGKFIVNKDIYTLCEENNEAYYFNEPYEGIKTVFPYSLYEDIINNRFDYENNFFESSYNINDICIKNVMILIDNLLNKSLK